MHVAYQGAVPFDFKGLQIRELTPGDLSAASFAEIEVAPGIKHDRARTTRCDKVYLCLEGRPLFRVEERDVRLEARDLLLIRKNEWFEYLNDSDQIVRLFLVHVPPFDLESEEFRQEEPSGERQ